jgi:hypothetical protein
MTRIKVSGPDRTPIPSAPEIVEVTNTYDVDAYKTGTFTRVTIFSGIEFDPQKITAGMENAWQAYRSAIRDTFRGQMSKRDFMAGWYAAQGSKVHLLDHLRPLQGES